MSDAYAATTARERFIPKRMGENKKDPWRVYDIQNGSFPYQTPELGKVLQDATEAEIVAECARLAAAHGGINAKAKAAASKTEKARAIATGDDLPDETQATEDEDAA